jgi:hypothetical protein
VLAAFAVAVAGLAAFGVLQARGRHPMMPLDLFRSRMVSIAVVTGFAFMVGYYGLPFVMSLYFQQLRGLSALGTCGVSELCRWLWPGLSGSSLIFVDEAAEDWPALDSFLGVIDHRVIGPG